MALGARSLQVIRMIVVKNGGGLVCGLAAGFWIARSASRAIEGLLHGLTRFDAIAYAGVLVGVLLAGVIASAIPARRATRTDPVVALREE